MRIDVFENGAALVQLDGIALFVAAIPFARKAGEVDKQLHQFIRHIHVGKLALFGHVQNGFNARLVFDLVQHAQNDGGLLFRALHNGRALHAGEDVEKVVARVVAKLDGVVDKIGIVDDFENSENIVEESEEK